MFNTYKNPAKAYASTNIESNAIAGNPHKLIAMLYEGALIAILQAEHHMKQNNVIEKKIESLNTKITKKKIKKNAPKIKMIIVKKKKNL